jgi:uncharacterized OsmC-like protein
MRGIVLTMSEELLLTSVHARNSGIAGRCIAGARNHHFVIDEPAYGGGPGEELTPAEVFLSGIAGCAALLVESFAHQSAYPLKRVSTKMQGIRAKSNPADFKQVNLSFELFGVDSKQADDLVDRFKAR